MKKKFSFVVVIVMILTLVFSSAAFAFQDLPGGSISEKIMNLKERDIIKGFHESRFAPDQELTASQAVQLIVRGFDLNIDHIRFIREPKASDYFENAADDAWYAPAFIIAQHNGLELPKDINPNKKITREEYAHYLFQVMETKADFMMIKIWIEIADEENINKEYMNSIQSMLILEIMSLNEDQLFQPQTSLKRSEAAVLLHDALAFIEKYSVEPGDSEPVPNEPVPAEPVVDEDVSMTIEEISEDINKIVIDWGEKPNSGYRITIDSIEFNHETAKAVIHYTLHEPLPDQMYLQVITYPKAETYISSQYEVSISPVTMESGIHPAMPGHVIPDMPEEMIH
jgi:hypothetical protein